MRVIVTGGAGFVGSHLCDLLLAEGHEVMAYDVLVPQVHGGTGLQATKGHGFPPWPSYMDGRVVQWLGDVGNTAEVYRALKAFLPDVVVHLAAYVGVAQSWTYPAAYLYGGPVITASLYEAIRQHNADQDKAEGGGTKVRRVFVAGSMASYGEGPVDLVVHDGCGRVIGTIGGCRGDVPSTSEFTHGEPEPTREKWPQRPQNPYAYSKMYAEQVALNLGAQMGIETVVGRFFNVLGSRQSLGNPYTGVVAMWASALLAGQAPVVFEDGEQSRDFIHVSDVARAVLTILERGEAGEVYNVGRGERTRILDVARWLCAEHGGGLAPNLPGLKRAGDIRHCYADATKLRALGWAPQVTLSEAMREQWAWAQQQALDVSEAQIGWHKSIKEAERDGVLRALNWAEPLDTPTGPAINEDAAQDGGDDV